MYNEAFGFSESPFSLAPDPKFIFLTEGHQETLAAMIYGITERKGFVSVSGNFGMGKTTLIHHLRHKLDPAVKVVFISEAPPTFEHLLQEIFKGLNLEPAGHEKGALLHQLNEYLIAKLAGNENLAIVIDDAERLNKDAMEDLRLLSNLETPTSKLLQIILVGQPELEDKLNSPELRQLKQRLVIRRQMKPLTLEESEDYIDHRLNVAGTAASNIFTPEALSLVCRHAKGIPRAINILCDKALLLGFAYSRENIDADIVKDAIRDKKAPPRKEPVSEPKITPGSQPLPIRRAKHSESALRKKILIPIVSAAAVLLIILLGREYFGGNSEQFTASLKQQPPAPEKSLTPLPEKKVDSSPKGTGDSVPRVTPKPETPPEKKMEREKASIQPPGISKPEPSPVQSRTKPNVKIITVQYGDSISSLCLRYYRSANITLIDYIMEMNPEITNPHLITVNQRIKLPEISEASVIIGSGDARQIHLATFERREQAAIYRGEPALKGKKIEVKIRKFVPHGTWFQAVAGDFKTDQEALNAIQILKKKGLLPIFGGKLSQ